MASNDGGCKFGLSPNTRSRADETEFIDVVKHSGGMHAFRVSTIYIKSTKTFSNETVKKNEED